MSTSNIFYGEITNSIRQSPSNTHIVCFGMSVTCINHKNTSSNNSMGCNVGRFQWSSFFVFLRLLFFALLLLYVT